MTITNRFKLLFAIPLIWVTLISVMSIVFLYADGRSNKTPDDVTTYSPQVINKFVTILSQSLEAFENFVLMDQINRQDENANTQQLSTALHNNFLKQTEKKYQEINSLLIVLANTVTLAEEKERYASIARIFQNTYRPQLLVPSIDEAQPKTEDLAERLARANLAFQAILKDIDGLTTQKITDTQIRQVQYQNRLESFENIFWGIIISLMVMIILVSWMVIDIKVILRKILGAPPEEIEKLVDQIFKSRLGVEMSAEVAMPKNVKTALNLFLETRMRFFSDLKKIHHSILADDHQARFNLRAHHPESREALGLINAMLDHVAFSPVDPKVPVLNTATTLPINTTSLAAPETEDMLQHSIDAANEKIAKTEESLNQARSLGEDVAQSFHTLQTSHGIHLKLNQYQHAELHYSGEQTTALLQCIQQIPDRLMDGEKVCDILISSTLEEEKQLTTLSNAISLIQKNTQHVSAQLGILENIALQGDMLSFNIAIEVARLGDQGRGFSAIGNEVRHLAERAMAQTHSIRTVISDTDSNVFSAQESLSQAKMTNKELLGLTHRLIALTQASVEEAHTSIQGLSELSMVHEQMEGHSHEQGLLVHHQAVQSNKLSQLMGTFLSSLESSEKNQTDSTQILALNVVNDNEVLAAIPSISAVDASSLSIDQTTENKQSTASNKPVAVNDWSLF